MVIVLCAAMMLAEIVGGLAFGSIALVADGLHMSTHAGALLLAAGAYTYARRHADDPRFVFGTGKLGDLAGFTSAIVLAMIAILIGYESIVRLLSPLPIRFEEAIPIAVLGLVVNVVSAWLLSGGQHHGHPGDERIMLDVTGGQASLEVHEDGVPPRFRLVLPQSAGASARAASIVTERPNGARQQFVMLDRGQFFESAEEIPEPHAFVAFVSVDGAEPMAAPFSEEEGHGHGHGHHGDNNMRAALVHVAADAAVSVLVIVGLLLARGFGWLWMDPVAGLVGAGVIASWAFGLVRDTCAILLDMSPSANLTQRLREAVESDGDRLTDLHLWRLGPGHLGAVLAVETASGRSPEFYRRLLSAFPSLSHVSVEVSGRNA